MTGTARHRAPAIPQGFHARRRGPAGALFRALGISHLYASPLLTARPGSTHGYDIVDHHAINPELGGEPALRRLVGALRAHGMGLILDIVPNHMGVGGADNAWWLDVLEWGRASPLRRAISTSTGSRRTLGCGASCLPRSSARPTARCWPPAILC